MKKILALATVAASLFIGQAKADLISEFQPNPEGTDPATTQIEIWGTAGANFDLTFLTIEAEGTAAGVIDSFHTFSGTYDSNGLFVTSRNDFENPAFTAFLVTGFTGALSQDLDTNNDGVLDITPWATITDSLNVPDGGSITSGDRFYGANGLTVPTAAGVDDEPISVFRSGSNGDWYGIYETPDTSLTYGVYDSAGNLVDPNLFDIDPTVTTSTYGSINPTLNAIPEPAATLVLGSLAAAGLAFRRRRA